MLTSLEYLLPLCGVYCMVTISVDSWTNYCKEFGKTFFSVLIKTDRVCGGVKKIIKKEFQSISGVVYIVLHNPRVC